MVNGLNAAQCETTNISYYIEINVTYYLKCYWACEVGCNRTGLALLIGPSINNMFKVEIYWYMMKVIYIKSQTTLVYTSFTSSVFTKSFVYCT